MHLGIDSSVGAPGAATDPPPGRSSRVGEDGLELRQRDRSVEREEEDVIDSCQRNSKNGRKVGHEIQTQNINLNSRIYFGSLVNDSHLLLLLPQFCHLVTHWNKQHYWLEAKECVGMLGPR